MSSFAEMCRNGHPLTSIATTDVLMHLVLYSEGKFPETIMRAPLSVATDVLGQASTLSMVLEWMVALLGAEQSAAAMSTCRIGVHVLRQAVLDLERAMGSKHPQTLVVLYCLAFQLMFAEKEYVKVEKELLKLWSTSSQVLGEENFSQSTYSRL